MSARVLCFFFCWMAGCASSWQRLDLAGLPSAAAYPDSNALVLVDEMDVQFSERGKMPVVDVRRHVLARILREGGEAVAKVVVPYSDAFCSIVSFQARTIAPDGTIKVYSRSAAADVAAHAAFELYSDQRALVLTAEPTLPGTVVEYDYTVRYTELRLFDFKQAFGTELPAKLVRLKVTAPNGWTVEHLARHLNATVDFPPTVERGAHDTRSTWVGRDVAAIRPEPFAPSTAQSSTVVKVRLRSWTENGKTVDAPRDARELSAFMHRLTVVPSPNETSRALAATVVAGLTSPAEKARTLYNWVRDNISYCAIEIGMGGFRPHPSADVLRLHYGDCKDKANLLVKMLDAAGVGARLAHVYSHDGMPHRFGLPTGSNFNHAIVAIDLDGKTMFADPTSRAAPFGVLPVSDQEADLLPISADGIDLTAAPPSAAEDNLEDITFDISFKNLILKTQFKAILSGYFAERLRTQLLMTAEGKWWSPVGKALSLGRARIWVGAIGNGKPPERAALMTVAGGAEMVDVLSTGPTQVLRLSDFLDSVAPVLPDGERASPVVFRCRKQVIHRVRISIPDNQEISALPHSVTIEKPFGHFAMSWKHEGSMLEIERSLILSERVFPAERYPELKSFFDDVANAEARSVTMRKKR